MMEILTARENRWLYTNTLVETYKLPVIIITLNIPGEHKYNEDYLYCHNAITKDFVDWLYSRKLSILYFEARVDKDGPEVFIIVNSSINDLKKIAIDFEENHFLGRVADIDVKGKDKKMVSRRDLGLDERRCLICDNPARKCILSNTHTLKDLLIVIDELVSKYKLMEENPNGADNFEKNS